MPISKEIKEASAEITELIKLLTSKTYLMEAMITEESDAEFFIQLGNDYIELGKKFKTKGEYIRSKLRK